MEDARNEKDRNVRQAHPGQQPHPGQGQSGQKGKEDKKEQSGNPRSGESDRNRR